MTEHNPFVEEPLLDDNELVVQIRAGSREALETLVRRHQSWIYALALVDVDADSRIVIGFQTRVIDTICRWFPETVHVLAARYTMQ